VTRVPPAKAADLMVEDVLTVRPATSVAELARLLVENRISAVPVLDDSGALVGIVSEGDLLRRGETGTERHRSWWLELLVGNATLAGEYVKARGRTVADVMTREVVTADEATPLARLAELMETHHVKRLPILRGKRLVGIVSRADLVAALAAPQAAAPGGAAQGSVRAAFLAALRAQPWGRAAAIRATARGGVLYLHGVVGTAEEKRAVELLARGTPGVRELRSDLAVLNPLPPM
jgi:CBS domain-containing protein